MITNVDPHIQRIIDWRESFATLPDHHFFELIRMYLGEVHTPYNKQKLIEELGSFLRKEENRKTIVALLSDSDIQIISAVKVIPHVTQEKLGAFFSGTFTFASLYERLLNLEERLILYRHADQKTHGIIIDINPMLEDVLEPYLSRTALLPPASVMTQTLHESPLTPELISAFISYLYTDTGVCKADGAFKKRAAVRIEELFPGKVAQLQLLMTAFINLSLVKETEDGFAVDNARFARFAELDDQVQYAYLCVASQGRFSRDGLMRQAQLLLDCASSIPRSGFTRTVLLRSAFIISEQEDDAPGLAPRNTQSRFAQIINKARAAESQGTTSAQETNVGSMIDRLLDSAALFGLLTECGKTSSQDENFPDESVYISGPLITDVRPSFDGANISEKNTIPVLSIDAGFTVTLLPGLHLAQLLPLMKFMDVRRYDTAAVFEITRKSTMRAFDAGENTAGMCMLLERYSPYGIPQNLRISIDDWSRSYCSASLYKGYVLQVSEENCIAVENNPAISKHIKLTLAIGIYLLDVNTDEEASSLIAESGLDFIGKIKTAEPAPETAGFPLLRNGRNYLANQKKTETSDDETFASSSETAINNNFPRGTDKQRAEIFDSLRASLSKMNYSPEQNDGLLSRIQRKIILTPAQLRGDSVRMERIEAGGMDFLGKVHVIEHAITTDSMIELEYESEKNADSAGEGTKSDSDGVVTLVGTPVSIEKQTDDAVVCLRVEPEHTEQLFSIGRARLVKRIRGSVFKEREE